MPLKKSSGSKKSAHSRKTATNGKVFKDADDSLTERDEHLDQLFTETLDRDIERCNPTDQQSEKHEHTDRERERTRKRIFSDTDSKSALIAPDISANTVNTFRDLFNIELDRFTAIPRSVRIRHNVDFNTLLWNRLGLEISRLGKDFAVLETYPSDFQHEIIEWFFVRVHGSIEEIHCEEEIAWTKAASVYLDRLRLEHNEPEFESSVVSEEAVADSMGTIESWEDDLGSEDFNFSEFFAAGVLCLLKLYGMEESVRYKDILTALQVKFEKDTSLLEVDSEARIAEFLSNVDREIAQKMAEDRIEAGKEYFEELCQSNMIDDRVEEDASLFVILPSDEETNYASVVEENMGLLGWKSDGNSSSTARITLLDSVQKECDSAAATVEESLVSSTDGSSIQSTGEHNQISILLKGVRYVGTVSSTSSSTRDEFEDFEGVPTASVDAGKSPRNETIKEQSARLLIQHRKSQDLTAKPKRSRHRRTALCAVKEELCTDDGADPDNTDTLESPNVAVRDDPADVIGRRAIQYILHRKSKSSRRVRCDACRKWKKPVKIGPPMIIFRFGCWRKVVLTVSYSIPVFSSAAVRYAKFRSNLRYKPGD